MDIEETLEILERSDAHRGFIRYVEEAHERGGTPILSSLQNSLEHVTVEEWAARGTVIEETLCREGVEGALKHSHLDQTNREICEAIANESESTGVETL